MSMSGLREKRLQRDTHIFQPINHMFDRDLVTRTLKMHPSKFIGCCLANPAEDGSSILQFEHLVLKKGCRGVRFDPNIWPSDQKIINEIGKALFSRAGELGMPVGLMCAKGISFHLSEIEELCSKFPSISVILDHMGFCKPPINDKKKGGLFFFFFFFWLLRLSKFPQVYLKNCSTSFSAFMVLIIDQGTIILLL